MADKERRTRYAMKLFVVNWKCQSYDRGAYVMREHSDIITASSKTKVKNALLKAEPDARIISVEEIGLA